MAVHSALEHALHLRCYTLHHSRHENCVTVVYSTELLNAGSQRQAGERNLDLTAQTRPLARRPPLVCELKIKILLNFKIPMRAF
jgi:hypothetical protein